jgi:hypothetical protein
VLRTRSGKVARPIIPLQLTHALGQTYHSPNSLILVVTPDVLFEFTGIWTQISLNTPVWRRKDLRLIPKSQRARSAKVIAYKKLS